MLSVSPIGNFANDLKLEVKADAWHPVTLAALHAIDEKGKLIAVSDLWLAKLGYSRAEVLGRPCQDFFASGSRECVVNEILPQSFRFGRCEDVQLQMLRKDGQIIDVLQSGVLDDSVTAGGRVFVAIVTDVTSLKESQRQLVESEARYRSLVEDQSELISLAKPDGELRYVNRAYALLYGKQPQEMIGQNLFNFIPPERRAAIADHFQKLCNGKHHIEVENQVVLPNGQKRLIAWTNKALANEDGTVTAIHSVGRDIEQRVAVQERLRESEARYRFLAENSTDMIVIVGRDGYRSYVSPACRTLLGYEPEEMLEINTLDAVHPDDVAIVREVLASRQTDGTLTYRMRRKDGRYVWVEAAGGPKNLAGRADQHITVVRNIEERIAAEQRIKDSEARYRLLADHSTDVVFQLDLDLLYRYLSPACQEILGYEPKGMLGVDPLSITHAEDTERLSLTFQSLLTGRTESASAIYRICNHDGGWIWVETKLRVLRDPQTGEPSGIIGALRDVSKRKAFEEELVEANRRLRAAADEASAKSIQLEAAIANISQGLCMFNAEQRLLINNDRYIQMYGLPRELIVPGCSFRSILEYRKATGNFIGDVDEFIFQLSKNIANGQPYCATTLANGRTVAVVNQPMPGGGWVATHEDITERKSSEAKIEQLAHYDALTNLANRNLFREKMEETLARWRRLCTEFAIFLLDLDKFKQVNDTFGHQAGDSLLQAVAERIRNTIREVDVAARLGGDEFALIVLPGQEGLLEGSQKLAARLLDRINAPYNIEGEKVSIGCSIGIALAPSHGVRSDELLKNADLALYKCKKSGRNCFHFFNSELKAEADSRNALENDLRQAIWREEFSLYYQPFVSTQTRQVEGVEALVRWHHPTKGLILPNQFIPIAEEAGLIVQLGEWVLTKACHDAAKMPDHFKVAVNISPSQFAKSNLVDTVIFALVDSQLSPERLEIEITEGVLLQETAQNLETLRQLQNLGVLIALDDFGVGYSSLSYLTSFPFNKVKIDKSFVEKLELTEARAVVKSVVQLSKMLQLLPCAEGIETEEQLLDIKSLGVEIGQGYLFGKPESLAEVLHTAWLNNPKAA